MNELMSRVEKMFLPKQKKRKEIAYSWLEELMNECFLKNISTDTGAYVLVELPRCKVYLRTKTYEEAGRVERPGFYKARNWSEDLIWGTPLSDITGGEYWNIIFGILDYVKKQSVEKSVA